ncbi:hypothetical protein K2Q00_00160 [Patescibacteria group bacterium]|nr:hypothetical protein [Patescibacteria group bacterium]
MEQRIIKIETQLIRHESLLESIAAAALRLEKGQERIEGMVQGLYFRDFQS